MDKKLLLIINPHAGRGVIKSRALDIIDIFVQAGYRVTCCPTQKSGDPTEMIRGMGEEFDRIVCCGGDGTVNEGLNGIMALKKRPEMGIIPIGTVNDYAYSLGIPSKVIKAAQVAAGGCPFPIDVGNFNGRYFTYAAAFGLLTDVSYRTNQQLKNVLGKLAYGLEAVRRLTAVKSYHLCVAHDGGYEEDEFILGLFSNSISVAGMRTAHRQALLDDGLLEIALIRMPTSMEQLQDIIDVMLNVESISTLKSDFLTFIRTTKATVTGAQPVDWTVDGESGGSHTAVEIAMEPRAITVIAGRDMASNSVGASDDGKKKKKGSWV